MLHTSIICQMGNHSFDSTYSSLLRSEFQSDNKPPKRTEKVSASAAHAIYIMS